MPRQHDADLCDRIRALEKRVQELEAQQAAHHCHGHWYGGWWQTGQFTYPQFTFTDTITFDGTNTTDTTAVLTSFNSHTDANIV